MEYITEPWQVVFLGVLGLVFGVVMWWWMHHDLPADVEVDDAGPVEIITRSFVAVLHWRPSHMSSSEDRAAAAAGTEAVHVPVLNTGTPASTGNGEPGGTESTPPDTDAAEGGTESWAAPRISTRLSDTETVTLLAVQHGNMAEIGFILRHNDRGTRIIRCFGRYDVIDALSTCQ